MGFGGKAKDGRRKPGWAELGSVGWAGGDRTVDGEMGCEGESERTDADKEAGRQTLRQTLRQTQKHSRSTGS